MPWGYAPLNSMWCTADAAYSHEGELYWPHHWTVFFKPATPVVAQLSAVDYREWLFDAPAVGPEFALGFTRVDWGPPDYPQSDVMDNVGLAPKLAVRRDMTRLDWGVLCSHCEVKWLVNIFFWGSVSET